MSDVNRLSDVDRLLDAAAQATARVRYCWLVTDRGAGICRTRPMGRLPADPGDDPWRLRFLTDGLSAKANDMRRAPKVSVIFDDDPHEAYVAVAGTATLIEDKAEIRGRWKKAYETYFPEGPERSGPIFLTVDTERLELWIRGVTPEPFGLKTTVLERDLGRAGGGWCWRR
jgi:general stress protein 26